MIINNKGRNSSLCSLGTRSQWIPGTSLTWLAGIGDTGWCETTRPSDHPKKDLGALSRLAKDNFVVPEKPIKPLELEVERGFLVW